MDLNSNLLSAVQADLTSVHSSEENKFLTDLSGGRSFWLGGKLGWTWSDGTPWDYQNWGPGSPSGVYQGQVEDCIENVASLYGEDEKGTWNDRGCNNIENSDLGYFCKAFHKGEKAFWSIVRIDRGN